MPPTRSGVTAQLIDAVSDRPLWAERYDRRLNDVFALQDALKQQIVAALTVELSPGEQAQLVNRPTENIEAYEYYLRGRQTTYLLSLRSIRMAYWALDNAIQLDPDFAEAYATLALQRAALNLDGTKAIITRNLPWWQASSALGRRTLRTLSSSGSMLQSEALGGGEHRAWFWTKFLESATLRLASGREKSAATSRRKTERT